MRMLMPWTSEHIKWLINTKKEIITNDGKIIQLWEFRYTNDEIILSAWAKHFRNHYCSDCEIDLLRNGSTFSRAEFLNKIKFPDKSVAPGPSIRAGDFGEILVADFLEYIHGYWVPSTRYSSKTIRNESTKGTDIIGFYIDKDDEKSLRDKLAIFEAKTQFSGINGKERLQDAVDGSAKDILRKAESLYAIKQRFLERNNFTEAKKIERFQNEIDHPYTEIYGAAALFETRLFDEELALSTKTSSHPNSDNLILLVITGEDMMKLVHELYRRAADEA